MNIIDDLQFNDARPAILSIRKNEKVNLLAVGLLEGQQLKKHKTKVPALLSVLKGSISFEMDGQITQLKQFDVFEIPPEIEHEVTADEKSVFLLLQEK